MQHNMCLYSSAINDCGNSYMSVVLCAFVVNVYCAIYIAC